MFGPTNENNHGQALFPPNQFLDKARSHAVNISSVNNVDLTAVVGGMEANGVWINKSFGLLHTLLMGTTDPADTARCSYWWSNLPEQYKQFSASRRRLDAIKPQTSTYVASATICELYESYGQSIE